MKNVLKKVLGNFRKSIFLGFINNNFQVFIVEGTPDPKISIIRKKDKTAKDISNFKIKAFFKNKLP